MVYFLETNLQSKFLGLDMDDTLIKVKSKAKFAKDQYDWEFWHDKVPSKIKAYHDQGFSIILFTNQKGISLGKTKLEHITEKIELIKRAVTLLFRWGFLYPHSLVVRMISIENREPECLILFKRKNSLI